jgi:hypothetical protein
MIIPKEAIAKAIEGGWQHWAYVGQPEDTFTDILAVNEGDQASIALSPEIWQALGKSLGWAKLHSCGRPFRFEPHGWWQCDFCDKAGLRG